MDGLRLFALSSQPASRQADNSVYISRATVFRMQDRILEKLRQAEIETL